MRELRRMGGRRDFALQADGGSAQGIQLLSCGHICDPDIRIRVFQNLPRKVGLLPSVESLEAQSTALEIISGVCLPSIDCPKRKRQPHTFENHHGCCSEGSVERSTCVAMLIKLCNFRVPSTATLPYKSLRVETGSESLALHSECPESARYCRLTRWCAILNVDERGRHRI
jgi:hypothetical protein